MVLAGTCIISRAKVRARELIDSAYTRLTDSGFLSKVKKLGREARKNFWLATAYFFCLPAGRSYNR